MNHISFRLEIDDKSYFMIGSSITELEVFQILLKRVGSQMKKTVFAKLFDVLSSIYNVELTAEEKELLRQFLNHANNAKKKQHFVDKHNKVNWEHLADFAGKDSPLQSVPHNS